MPRYNQMQVVTSQPSNKEQTSTRSSGNLYKVPKLVGACNYRTAMTRNTSLSLLQMINCTLKSSSSIWIQNKESHWSSYSKFIWMTVFAIFSRHPSLLQLLIQPRNLITRTSRRSHSILSCNNEIRTEAISNSSIVSLKFQVKQSNCSSKAKATFQTATCMLLRKIWS